MRRSVLEDVVDYCSKAPDLQSYSLLFLMAYIFLLRVPSEALPTVLSKTGPKQGAQSVLLLEGDELVLYLHKRKNKPAGSILRRGCWCQASSTTCPVHSLGPMIQEFGDGQPLFQGITPALALRTLRHVLAELKVPQANLHRTQDFRRGHAEDLRLSGASLRTILQAGEWRSPAFLKYLDVDRLEADMVMQAHVLDESDDAGE